MSIFVTRKTCELRGVTKGAPLAETRQGKEEFFSKRVEEKAYEKKSLKENPEIWKRPRDIFAGSKGEI